MKRLLAYITAGVLLGTIVTILPLRLFNYLSASTTGTTSGEGFFQFRDQTSDLTPFEENLKFMDLSPLTSSLIYAGLLFISSIIIGLGIYVLSKRRLKAFS